MENFYDSNISSWPYYGTPFNISLDWGMSQTDSRIASSISALTIQKRYCFIKNGTITLGGTTYNMYLVRTYRNLGYSIPSIYIYSNKTHIVNNNPTQFRIMGGQGQPLYPRFKKRTTQTPIRNSNGLLELITVDVAILYRDRYLGVYTEESFINTEISQHGQFQEPHVTVEPYQDLNSAIDLDYAVFEGYTEIIDFECSSASCIGVAGQLIEDMYALEQQVEIYGGSVFNHPSEGYYTDPNTTKRIYATLNGSTAFIAVVYVTDWKNKYYDLTFDSNKPTVYVGKQVGEEFLNSFKVTYTLSNNYKTLTTVNREALDINSMSQTKFGSTNRYISFSYTFPDNTTKMYNFGTNNFNVISFDYNTVFQNINKKSTYKWGEVFDSSTIDIKNSGSLTYTDGATIPLSEVDWSAEPYVTSSIDDPSIIDESISKFDVFYHMPTEYFGDLTHLFTTTVTGATEDYILSVVLQNAPEVLKPNSIVNFANSENAKLVCYNNNGGIVKTIPASESVGYITEYPSEHGKKVPDTYLTDEPISLLYGFEEYRTFGWTFYVAYYDKKLTLDTTNAKIRYFIGGDYGETLELDTEGLVAIARYHNNSFDTAGEIVEYDVSDSIIVSVPTIDVSTGSKIYTLTVSWTDDINSTGQTLTATYEISVTRYEAKTLEITGTTDTYHYWDNDEDTFHYPEGLIFNRIYSDGSVQQVTDLSKLTYYRDSAMSERLRSENSIVKYNAGNKIYVYDSITKTSVNYTIQFDVDTIEDVYLTNNVNFVLGNRFSIIRSLLSLEALYASGVVRPVEEYRFKNNDIILEDTSVVVIVNDSEYTLDSSKITFIKPNIASVTLNTNKFPLTYNNISDSINASTLAVTIAYEDAIYTEDCHFKNGQVIESDDEFLVTCDALPNFSFDGSEDLDLEASDLFDRKLTLNITVRNRFNNSSTVNNVATLVISVLEITEITGISLVKIYSDYHVGETFLNENDDTEVNLFYKDSSGIQRRLKIKLNSDFSSLNIFPLKGETFDTVTNSKTIRISCATNHNVSCEYTISVSANYVYSNPTTHEVVAVYQEGDYKTPNGDIVTDKYLLIARYDDEGLNNTQINLEGERVLSNKSIFDVKVFGYLEDIFDISKNARVILFEDYIGLVEGTNNITVKYPCYAASNADIINKCKFGILFGNNNAKNRLFISGNPDYPNCDWHSGQVDSDFLDDESMISGNFGYFEDTSYCYYGETDNAIVGYDIVSNDKLLVLKNKSDKETTVYFRTPTLVQAIDASGTAMTGIDGEALYQEEFPLTKGNNSIAAVSPRGIINFNGDSLFLSEDKNVIGLDLTGIVGDNQRYANTRSYLIDEDLKKYDMNEAWLWSNNKDLYLILKDKIFFTNYEAKGESQYEWWLMDIKDIQSVIEIDNVKYLANSEGSLYKVTDKYDDITKIFVGQGGSVFITEDALDDTIVVSQNVINSLNENDTYTFKVIPGDNEDTSYMYYQIATISNESQKTYDFYVNADKNCLELRGSINGQSDYDTINNLLTVIKETKYIYLNHLGSENEIGASHNNPLKTHYKKYYLKHFEDESLHYDCYKLIDAEKNTEVDISELYRATICYRMDGEYEITDIDKTSCSFKVKDEDNIINLVRYADQDIVRSFKGELRKYKPVEAYFITKPLTMGSLDYFKTIWSWTLTNDTSIPSELEITVANNKIPYESMRTLSNVSKDRLGIDLNELDFRKVDLQKNVVPRTYTNQRIISQLKFICFGFRNLNNTNSVLSSMSIIYTIPFPSYGSD